MKNKGLSILLSFVLVLMLTVSFSVPVNAADNNTVSGSFDVDIVNELTGDDVELLSSSSGSISTDPSSTSARYINYVQNKGLGYFSLASNLESDSLYYVEYDLTLNVISDVLVASRLRNVEIDYLGKPLYFKSLVGLNSDDIGYSSTITYSSNLYAYGSDLMNSSRLSLNVILAHSSPTTITLDYDVSFSASSIKLVSSVDTDSYENGYNAGYSDGLLDGEASVDTEAIYNEAYQAGYDAGFLDGSDDSLVDDKVFLKNYKGSFDMNGIVQISEHRDYADPDDLFFGSGYASGSVNLFNQYTFDIGKDYLIDFKNIYVVNSSPTFDIYDGAVQNSSVSILPSYSLSGAGIYMSDTGELIYSPTQTGNTNLTASVRGDMTMTGDWNKGVNNDYVQIPEYSFALGSMNWTSTVYYDIDVYEVNIVEEIDYLRDQSNKLGSLNEKQDATIDSIDNLTDTTNQQTESLNQATQQQTDTLTSGFDSSSMSSSNTALSGSIAEFTGAESQITDQSFGFIDQVQFYDLNMQPQLLACITFCSSWLQSLFVNIGDWGILVMVSLSLGFGLMLIGWSKYRRK